ncbi:MAG TPA: DUF433 domain-containing protein [Blastocatellia bacterium]|nr:DUF433 domain-containing protein [Blastocatellia bacterium]
MQDWQERMAVNSDLCQGKACIRGARIMVSVVLDNLADGLSPEEIVEKYPPLTLDDIRAAISNAATFAKKKFSHSAERRMLLKLDEYPGRTRIELLGAQPDH